jgi:hypothetical protein
VIHDILQESGNYLFARPERAGFDNGRGHCNDFVQFSILKKLSQADIDELLILVFGEESVLGGHENT